MSTDVQIHISELQILLNMFKDVLRVNYPLYAFDLFDVKRDYERCDLKIACTDMDFQKSSVQFGPDENELPQYGDFYDCFRSAGILQYRNMDEFKTRLSSYGKLSKSVKFSLDTNLFYHCFISNYKLIKPEDIVLVSLVSEEIEERLNYKYKPEMHSRIKQNAKYQKGLIDQLYNKRVKKSRKAAYLALREYRYILNGVAEVLDKVVSSAIREGENDRNIVKTLSKFGKGTIHLPVLLTADDAMVDLCKTEDLEYFKFDLTYDLSNFNCSYPQLRELIFNIAVVFGFIKLNNVIVFGEFIEKSSNYPDELKLRFLDNTSYDAFMHDLTICRELMKLEMGK